MTRHEYSIEAPCFASVDEFAIGYMFELKMPRAGSAPRAFRLETINKRLRAERPEAYEALVEPVRSYHDDVTTGGPGRGGRPFIFLAEASAPLKAGGGYHPGGIRDHRRATLHIPKEWDYLAEGRHVHMISPQAAARTVELGFRDSFCVFESGRLFYIITFFPAAGSKCRLDEYSLIALEKLASRKPEDAAFASRWLFEHDGRPPRTLYAMASRRLKSLCAKPRDGVINGARIVLRELLELSHRRMTEVGRAHVRGMLIAIDHKGLVGHAAIASGLDESFEVPRAPKARPQSAERAPSIPRRFDWHRDDKDGAYLPYLSLAGMVQSVIDFPYQDPSELYDSTRPVFSGNGFFIYSHPQFTLQISEEDRTLLEGRKSLGTCPYLCLMWLVAVHDELIVTEIEEQIDELIYGRQENQLTAEPLEGLAKVLGAMKRIGGSPTGELHANLDRRFQLFRTYAINRSHYLFRYPKEKEALARIEAASGTSDRFQRAQETIDRLESLIEDMTSLRSAYAERRTNAALAAIAILSIVSVASDFQQQTDGESVAPSFWLTGSIVMLVVLAILFGAPAWNSLKGLRAGLARRRQDKRDSKSS